MDTELCIMAAILSWLGESQRAAVKLRRAGRNAVELVWGVGL